MLNISLKPLFMWLLLFDKLTINPKNDKGSAQNAYKNTYPIMQRGPCDLYEPISDLFTTTRL